MDDGLCGAGAVAAAAAAPAAPSRSPGRHVHVP